MSNLATAASRAQAISGPKSAARLYNDIEWELALGEASEDDDAQGEEALRILEQRYPGVRTQARQVTDHPNLSHSARKQLPDAPGRRRGEHPADPAHPGNRRGGQHTTPRSPSPSASRPRASSGSSSSRGAGPGLGDLAPNVDFTDVALGGIRILLLLGLGYFILTPKGSSAFGTVLGYGSGLVRSLVSPVDPLASTGAPVSPAVARAVAQAQKNVIDTPGGGTAIARPPAGYVDVAPGVTAPGKPPTNIPGLKVTGPRGARLRQSIGPYAGGITP